MFDPRFSFLNSTRYTHGRRSLRGALSDGVEYGVSPSGVEYIYDPTGRSERPVYDAYGSSERQPAECPRRFNVDELNYQFQGLRHETDSVPVPSSEPSAPSLLNFQIRAFHPKSAPWTSADPAGYVDGMNAYLFSGGDPVNPVKPI